MNFGTASAGGGISFTSGKELRFGRVALENAHGSELVALPVPFTAEYFNGTYFVDHAADSCTTLVVGNVALTPNPGGLVSAATLANSPLLSGDAGLSLSAPGSGNTGYFDVGYDLTSYSWLLGDWDGDNGWDDNPSSRATFGIFRGPDMLIYSREIY